MRWSPKKPMSLVVAVLLLGGFSENRVIGEGIQARVVESREKVAILESDSKIPPKLDDKVEIFLNLPDEGGAALIATGSVSSVAEGVIIVKLDRVMGRVQKNQHATILSPAAASPVARIPTAVEPVPPTSERAVGFAGVVRRYKQAVCIAENPQTKSFGTAFVISKKHRLVVTNAHVADFATQVVLNESRAVYKIAGCVYHPDVLRVLRYDNRTVIRAADATLGEVFPGCPDLAVLKLEDIGADLPAEVELATPAEIRDLQGTAVGMFGYPGYDSESNPAVYASATFVEGTVSRLTGFLQYPEVPENQRRLVAFTAPNYAGFSGSPVFLPNGKVVLINSYMRQLEDGSKLAYGPRVDTLWDLLAKAEVAADIPGAPADLPKPVFWDDFENPAATSLLSAVGNTEEAAAFRQQKNLDAALEALSKAEKEAPEYWRLYDERAKVFSAYVGAASSQLSRAERERAHISTLNQLNIAQEKFVESFGKASVEIALDIARQHINMARVTSDQKHLEAAVELLSNESLQQNVGDSLAYYYALRGSAQKDRGNLKEALEDLNRAIDTSPRSSSFYRERAHIWRKLGQERAAQSDDELAARLAP